MRVTLMSDLHLEFDQDHERHIAPEDHPHRLDRGDRRIVGPDLRILKQAAPDVVVLAGDIDVGLNGFEYARQVRDYLGCPVVMVAGNHEFYGHDMLRIRDLLRWEQEHDTGIHILENEAVDIGGARFIGATLWTDFALNGDDGMADAVATAAAGLSDYRDISFDGIPYSPAQARAVHRDSVGRLNRLLSQVRGKPAIVVSHHAPHPGSIPDGRRMDRFAPSYASDLSWLIERHQPAFWLHGHVHVPSDYRVGQTRVLCNPRGYYPHALVRDFRPDLIINVETAS